MWPRKSSGEPSWNGSSRQILKMKDWLSGSGVDGMASIIFACKFWLHLGQFRAPSW